MSRTLAAIKTTLRKSRLRRAVMSFRHTGLDEADVFVASYPRSGNTWLKSLLVSSIFGEALENFSDTVNPVIPIVGFHRNVNPLLSGAGRIIKTHECFRREYKKAVWIVRDPRDVVISDYKLQQRSHFFSGSFDDFLGQFTTTELTGPPDWQTHSRSWMQSSLNDSELLKLRFEDMRSDTGNALDQVLRFMGLESNDDIIEKALQQNSLRSMSERHQRFDQTLGTSVNTELPAVNKGQSGGWRDSLTPDQVDLIENRFGDTIEALGYERSRS